MPEEGIDQFSGSHSQLNINKLFKLLNKKMNLKYTKESTFDLGINVTSADGSAFTMLVTGCQGEGNQAQRNVAQAMNNHFQKYKPQHTAGLLLGDNFYDSGVDTRNDPKFKTLFSKIYRQDFNWFAALGNHDWNFQNRIKTWLGATETHHKKAMAQVDHTYTIDHAGNKIDTWLMPHRYYVIETNWANIIVLDSNTLCFDEVQQEWFKNTLIKAKKKTSLRNNVIAMHHPLLSVGKRNPFSDIKDVHQYLLKEYHYTGPQDTSLNDLLLTLFKKIKTELGKNFNIALILCAHDHFLAASELYELGCKQLTIGGGGGHLQDIKIEKTCDFSAKKHGFVKLKLNQQTINYTFYDEISQNLHNDNTLAKFNCNPQPQKPRSMTMT